MHRLLQRQLTRHLPGQDEPPTTWEALLQAVSDAYEQADADRQLLERSLELTSQELIQRNAELRQRLTRLEQAEADLRAANADLAAKMKQLQLFNRVMMGREERILELKERLKVLRARVNANTGTRPATPAS